MAAAFLFCVTGCKANRPLEERAEKEPEESFAQNESGEVMSQVLDVTQAALQPELVTVEFTDEEDTQYDDDGTELLSWSFQYPDIMIPGNPAAAEEINAYFSDEKTREESVIRDYTDNAKEEYEFSKEESLPFSAWELRFRNAVQRKDSVCISFTQQLIEYAGGAHPNSYESAVNFDGKTGKKLLLADVVSNVDTAHREAEEFIRKEIEEKYRDYVMEDYEENIGDILTEDAWYLDGNGFSIICNEYIIGPHAMGIVVFTIPYDECGFLKENYKSFQ